MSIEDVVKLAAEAGAKAALELIAGTDKEAIRRAVQAVYEDAVRAGVELCKRIETEERNAVWDARLHNTRLLLKNYRQLKLHFEEALFDFDEEHAENAPGAIWEIMSAHYDREAAFIDSIWRSAARTGVMISHVDRMLDLFKTACERSGRESDRRQWRILHARYLGDTPKSMQQIADEEHIHKRTAEKDLDNATQAVSALLFGLDGVANRA